MNSLALHSSRLLLSYYLTPILPQERPSTPCTEMGKNCTFGPRLGFLLVHDLIMDPQRSSVMTSVGPRVSPSATHVPPSRTTMTAEALGRNGPATKFKEKLWRGKHCLVAWLGIPSHQKASLVLNRCIRSGACPEMQQVPVTAHPSFGTDSHVTQQLYDPFKPHIIWPKQSKPNMVIEQVCRYL